MTHSLRYTYGHQTIAQLTETWENGRLNLSPGFQRQSVWKLSDRRKLIESILQHFPIPSIFLYRRDEGDWPVYDVIDGKQRLETILMFSKAKGFGGDGFEVVPPASDELGTEPVGWTKLKKAGQTARFRSYSIPTVEVSGDLGDIIDLFVRINSTGKALTSSEKRHARFYESPLLRTAATLARQLRKFLLAERIVSADQIQRMRDIELISELLASILSGGPVNKKQAIDSAIGSHKFNKASLDRASRELKSSIVKLRKLFPELQATRFRRVPEFYTLVLLVWEWERRKLVLSDRKRNQVAASLLEQFSAGVDSVRERSKKGKKVEPHEQPFLNYLFTVQQATDNLPERLKRAEILGEVFSGLFEHKDNRRIFSETQRRLLWHSSVAKKCAACGSPLTWGNFHVDHVKAHSKGGKTDLANAALLCAPCNLRKGSRSPEAGEKKLARKRTKKKVVKRSVKKTGRR